MLTAQAFSDSWQVPSRVWLARACGREYHAVDAWPADCFVVSADPQRCALYEMVRRTFLAEHESCVTIGTDVEAALRCGLSNQRHSLPAQASS
ncbi:MAG: hypothetical protein AAGF31_05850 [Planctomycetota bacterium]